MLYTTVLASLLATTVSAQIKGFNYGATLENGACRDQSNFQGLFNRAKNLAGTSGFASARLYTTIQCGSANDPTSAIQAAIDTDTTLLLGMWASAGSDAFNNELTALRRAIEKYPNLADTVVGISVGSEDLYRASPQGVANNAGVGADASALVDYIGRVKQAISGTTLSQKPVGHVDTWTAWVLPENARVAQAVDWLGHNSFPYFESTRSNSIDEAQSNFNTALANTESVAGGKPVYVTETGWPHSGPQSAQAVASKDNAERYWKTVGCSLFGNRNTWWYTLEDANTAQTEIEFGVTGVGSNTPIYDLSCSNPVSSSSSSSATSSSTTLVPQSSSSTQSSTTSSSSTVSSSTESSSSTEQSSTESSTEQSSTTSSEPASSASPTPSVVFTTITSGNGGVETITSIATATPTPTEDTTTSAPASSSTVVTGGTNNAARLSVGQAGGLVAMLIGGFALA